MRLKRPVYKYVVLLGGAAIYALLFSLGSQIDRAGVTQLKTSMLRFALAFPAALCVLHVLFACVLPHLEMRGEERPQRAFCTPGAFAVLLCCYVPMFLIQYPGTFQYDSMRQVAQIASRQYDAFHPLLHTLFIRFCLSFYGVLQSLEKCGAIYSVIQMLLVSAGFALLCASVSRSVAPRAARLSLLFFALYPSHMAFASSCTKDVLFSVSVALFVALCLEESRLGRLGGGHRVLQIFCGVISCLMRNNMIYAMIAWVVVLALCRKPFRRMLLWSAVIVIASRCLNTGLMKATDAEEGKLVEMLSVPLQQLARARLYADEVFTEEERALMDEVMRDEATLEPVYPNYDPTVSDPVKNWIDDDMVKQRLPELATLWASVGSKCPGVYLDAFLNLALPSLYPYSEYKVSHRYIEMGGDRSLTSPFGLGPIARPQRFAAMRQWLDTHLFMTGADDVPLIRYLFNTGFIYWLLLLFMLYDLYCGSWRRTAVLLLVVFLWGTYLLGPVMQGRYLYPFICILPLFVLRPEYDCAQ